MEQNTTNANPDLPSNPEPVATGTPSSASSSPATNPATSKRKLPIWAKLLIGLGCFFVGMIILAVVIVVVVSINSKKLECSSSQGSITIMYDDNTVNGYLADGIGYDLDTQKSYAESIGVEDYLDEFTDWFELNTDGTCAKK